MKRFAILFSAAVCMGLISAQSADAADHNHHHRRGNFGGSAFSISIGNGFNGISYSRGYGGLYGGGLYGGGFYGGGINRGLYVPPVGIGGYHYARPIYSVPVRPIYGGGFYGGGYRGGCRGW